MDAKAAKALEDSIAHWKRMRDDPDCGEFPDAADDPLCNLFYGSRCKGCPVGSHNCMDTPYMDALTAWRKRTIAGAYAAWTVAAQAEIDFLESLREG